MISFVVLDPFLTLLLDIHIHSANLHFACLQSESYADRSGRVSVACVALSTPERCHSTALEAPKMAAFDRSPMLENTSLATGTTYHAAAAMIRPPLHYSFKAQQKPLADSEPPAESETPAGSNLATETKDTGGPRDLGPSLGQVGPREPEPTSAAAREGTTQQFDKPAQERAGEVFCRTASQAVPPGQLSDGTTNAAAGTIRTAQLAPTNLEEALQPPIVHAPMVRHAEQMTSRTRPHMADHLLSRVGQQPSRGSNDPEVNEAARLRQPPCHTHEVSTHEVSTHGAAQPPGVDSGRVASSSMHPLVGGADHVNSHVAHQEPPNTCFNRMLKYTCGLAVVPVERSRKNAS